MEFVHVLHFFLICFPVCMPANKWSMFTTEVVTGNLGKDAVIPCTFTVPSKSEEESIVVIWRTQEHYIGPVIFRCLSKPRASETGQNCSEMHGRYSLFGEPRSNNISLRIKNVSPMDEALYFCRVELSKSGSFETQTGTRLNIQVAPELKSIYIRTFASGEQFVTCDVTGSPPPTVRWILPENTSTSSVSVRSTCCSASSSVTYKPSTNYTCQIRGPHGLQEQTLYSQAATEQNCRITLQLFFSVVLVAGLFSILFFIITVFYIKAIVKTQHSREICRIKKNEDIYANIE